MIHFILTCACCRHLLRFDRSGSEIVLTFIPLPVSIVLIILYLDPTNSFLIDLFAPHFSCLQVISATVDRNLRAGPWRCHSPILMPLKTPQGPQGQEQTLQPGLWGPGDLALLSPDIFPSGTFRCCYAVVKWVFAGFLQPRILVHKL